MRWRKRPESTDLEAAKNAIEAEDIEVVPKAKENAKAKAEPKAAELQVKKAAKGKEKTAPIQEEEETPPLRKTQGKRKGKGKKQAAETYEPEPTPAKETGKCQNKGKDKVVSAFDATDVLRHRESLQICIEEDPYGDCPNPIRSFQELSSLPSYVLKSLSQYGIHSPMPIQAQALPLVLSGRDVIGLAQTGSGKTLAFLVPAAVHLEKHIHDKEGSESCPAPIVLVLAPTRELAVQIAEEADKVFEWQSSLRHSGIHTVCLYGGGDKWTQKKKLWRGAHIVVATPGRLSDFVGTNVLSLSKVSYFVLDEADRMLDLGFQEDVFTVARQIQPTRQILFFSATWGSNVQELAQDLCREGSKPVRISYGQSHDHAQGHSSTASKSQAREGIVQEVIVVDHPGEDGWKKQEEEKEDYLNKHLQDVLSASEQHKVLVFVSQKNLADKVSSRLKGLGFQADAMHGGKSQDYRLWVLDQFRKGELRLLVCTDVLGRGIDIPSVSHVVIHEMGEIDDYIHRIGRTARGLHGKGHALVFFEYWEGAPQLAAELIDVLAASKQLVPRELQRIADEVKDGKRKIRASDNQWKGKWHDQRKWR